MTIRGIIRVSRCCFAMHGNTSSLVGLNTVQLCSNTTHTSSSLIISPILFPLSCLLTSPIHQFINSSIHQSIIISISNQKSEIHLRNPIPLSMLILHRLPIPPLLPDTCHWQILSPWRMLSWRPPVHLIEERWRAETWRCLACSTIRAQLRLVHHELQARRLHQHAPQSTWVCTSTLLKL